MRVNGHPYRTLWLDDDGATVRIIDQTLLPHRFETRALMNVDAAAEAISTMRVRGAPLIGATAAYGYALAARTDASDAALRRAYERLLATRPTAVNLRWALDEMDAAVRALRVEERVAAAYARAATIAEEDVETSRRIGVHGGDPAHGPSTAHCPTVNAV